LPAIAQQGNQALGVRILRDVFVEIAVFCLPHHRVVALGHDLVVVLNDQARLKLVFKQNVQVLAHPLDLDVLGGRVLGALDLLQLVLGTRLRLDAHPLPSRARALRDVDDLVVFCFAGVDDDFVLLVHGETL
jgi:hypothetical protein